MQVIPIFGHNSLRNMTYLLVPQAGSEVICVDPYDADLVMAELDRRTLSLTRIINTHEHWDHIRGNGDLVRRYGCAVWAVAGVPQADRVMRGGEVSACGTATLTTVATPGHTMAHVCLLATAPSEASWLFSGDTLFHAGVGNCHNGGDVDTMFDTFETFFRGLGDGVRIMPGHDYLANNLAFATEQEPDNPMLATMTERLQSAAARGQCAVTTMGEERLYNPFLRLDATQIRNRTATAGADRREVFRTLRARRDAW